MYHRLKTPNNIQGTFNSVHFRFLYRIILKIYSHIKTVGRIDDVINQQGLLLVEWLHGSAATIAFYPLQHKTHDVDAEAEK